MSEWYSLTPTVADYLNEWADRRDLIVFLGPERGGGTAFCDLLRGEIEANTDFIFRGLEEADVVRFGITNFRKFPVAIGALYHEAMHARHTPILTADGARERDVLAMLEEPRIEYKGILHNEKMQRYLRASALRVAVETVKKDKRAGSIDGMPLALGRVFAGSLREKDVKKIRELYVEAYTEEKITAAEEIMQRYVHLDDDQHEDMKRYVKRWIDLFPDDGEDTPEIDLDDLIDAIESGAIEAGSGAVEDLDEDDRVAKRRQRDRERAEKEARKREAQKVKDNPAKPQDLVHSYYGSKGSTATVPFSERKPRPEEKQAAVRLSQILAQVEYTDKTRSKVASYTPPGRLKMRTVVQNRGARAAGSRARPEPEWEATRLTEVDTPTLRVGVIVDVSGSMSGAMAPMAVTGYVLKTALDRIQADSAVVYMGGVAVPSQTPKDTVQTWQAVAGWENFKHAVAVMDAELDLTLQEDGARLAVIVSDGNYRDEQEAAVMSWMQLLKRQGAGILWLGYGNSARAARMCQSAGADFVPLDGSESPADVASLVGSAAVRVLREKKM